MRFVRSASIGVVIGWLLLQPNPAVGRVSATSLYSKAQSYSAALRFLRVDKGFEVVEHDADAAYLIFRYPTPDRKEGTVTGAIEVVEIEDAVNLIVKLPEMPEYHERVLSEQLLRKLREEYGAPSKKHPEPEKKPKSKKPEKNQPPAPDDAED